MPARLTALCLSLAALLALAVPAAAPAAKSRKAKKAPAITKVTPMRLRVGATVTIRGRNFSSRRTRNTVIFRSSNGRSAFAKPKRASRSKLVLKVPVAAGRLLGAKSARFKLRVLSNGKFSKFTSKRLSPVLVPSNVAGSNGGKSPCTGADLDGDDLLPASLEAQIHTDPCLKDTDGDGIEDGYEYQSARDLNDDEDQNANSFLPYPGKRPYPNALDPSDANIDFDGDVLSLAEEFKLWKYTIASGAPRTLTPLGYSDGEQISLSARAADGRRHPTQGHAGYAKQAGFVSWAGSHGYRTVALSDGPPWHSSITRHNYGLFDFDRDGAEESVLAPGFRFRELPYNDFDLDGTVSDDERDEDGDGLSNYDETHGRMTQAYWVSCYQIEKRYRVQYAATDFLDPDTDGDGVLDGADDQDHDDIPNVLELSRNLASGFDDREPGTLCNPAQGLPAPPATHHASSYGRVNPFNPCLPAAWSRSCELHPSEATGAPFDGSPNWYSLN